MFGLIFAICVAGAAIATALSGVVERKVCRSSWLESNAKIAASVVVNAIFGTAVGLAIGSAIKFAMSA